LQAEIERLFDEKPEAYTEAHRRMFYEFQDALNEGRVRAAEPDAASATGWRVNAWVKKGILLGFRMGVVIDMSVGELSFRDKDTYPLKRMGADVRVVPGGSSVRNGCYIGKGVHAADVYQRGRVRGRRDDGGFARAGGELRAGWQELPCFGREPDWRGAGAGGRDAGGD
jgi:hypothetical protein